MRLLKELEEICYKTGIGYLLFESEEELIEARQEKPDAVLDSMLQQNPQLGLWTFNLPAGCTCPGATPYCKQECYGHKGNYVRFPKIQKGLHRLWAATKHRDFVRAMIRQIKGKKKWKDRPIRIHSVGDMYSEAYFDKWMKIIEALPNKQFYLYTRMWRVGTKWREMLDAAEAKHPNLLIHWSTDPSSEVPELAKRRAFIYDPKYKIYHRLMPEPNCLKQITTDGEEKMTCAICRRCVEKDVGDVTLIKHPPTSLVKRVVRELDIGRPFMSSDEIEDELQREKEKFKRGISRENRKYFEDKINKLEKALDMINESEESYSQVCRDCFRELKNETS